MDHDAENRKLVEQACVEFERDLRAFLSGMLRDVHLVDDAFQRTVVQAIEASSQVKPATVRGWLFRVALNVARELKRGRTRQGKLHKAVWESMLSQSPADMADGFSHLVSGEDKRAIQRALSRLSDDYREVVVRKIQRGQTFAVIAKEMNKPLGTVLTWMRRALAELREMEEVRQVGDQEST